MSDQSIKPPIITSFDLLKTAATLCLIINHYGFFFDQNAEFFKIIGRFGYLLFIFCFGYNKQFNFNPTLCFLTALMVINSFILEPKTLIFASMLDDHILFSVIIAQIFMYFIAPKLKEENIFNWLILLELLALPTGGLFKFGSEGIIICICGYLSATSIAKKKFNLFLIIGLIFYAIIELMKFKLNFFWLALLILAFIGLWRLINNFETKHIKIHACIDQMILFTSKYSLMIFFIHYEIFKFIHWYFY